MKQESIMLLSQLENLPNFEAVKTLLKNKYDNEINHLLGAFFQHIHRGYIYWDNNEDTILDSKIKMNNKSLLENTNHVIDFIPNDIQESMKNECKHVQKVEIKFDNRTFVLYICTPASYNNTKINNIIRFTTIWLYFANFFTAATCSKTVNIHIFFTNKTKNIPNVSTDTWDKIHVNTAFTTTCQPHTNVFIFREEEWFRALIHESFHNLGFDFLAMKPVNINTEESRIKEIFPINIDKLYYGETYNEMWAEILNIMFYVYENYSFGECTENNIKKLRSHFYRYILIERVFSVYQCAKLLHMNNTTYPQFLENPKSYRENTPAFSYYFLKCILSVHLDEFLQFCVNQFSYRANNEKKYSIIFYRSRINLNKYTNLFLKNYNSSVFKNALKLFEIKKKKINTTLFKTLRMSLIQMEITTPI